SIPAFKWRSKMSKKSNKKDKVGSVTSPVVRRVRVDEIVVKGNFRELNERTVADLAESFKEVGPLNPPTVYIKKSSDDEADTEEVRLVAGQHRVEAAKKIGWEFIDVI